MSGSRPRASLRVRWFAPANLHLSGALCALALLASGLARPAFAASAVDAPPLRFGFSSEAFLDVNENDARAALKVWAQTLGTERGIPVDPATDILNGLAAIEEALKSRRLDAVTVTTPEYWALRQVTPVEDTVLGISHGVTTEEYLLLVHRDSPATQLADLRGRRLVLLQGVRLSLAGIWLETALLENHLGTLRTFWAGTTRTTKIARAVLPVFFRQMDACIVTREGFRTMVELNPQVGRQLRILAQSEPMVPALFCFRGGLVSPYRDRLVAEIGRISGTVAGQQTLTLFQSESIEARPVSELDTALALLDRYHQLSAAAAPADGAPPAASAEKAP